jgi:ATP-dependent helicase HepA
MPFDRQQIVEFINNQRQQINKMLTVAEQNAATEMQSIINGASESMLKTLTAEIKRLTRLKKTNPSIKSDEIEYLKDMTLLAHEHIEMTKLRLDAVRFVITS